MSTISFEEMLEMASPGLQGAADPLGRIRRQVPRADARAAQLHALGHPDIDEEAKSGTLITFEEDEQMEQAVVSGIAFNRDEAKVTAAGRARQARHRVPDPGPCGRRQHRRRRDHPERRRRTGTTDFSFTVHRNELPRALDAAGATKVVGRRCRRPRV